MRIAITFISLVISAHAVKAQEQSDYSLKIKPQLCVIESDESVCKIPLLAQWQHPAAQIQTLCLYRERQVQALHCDAAQVGLQQVTWQADMASDERIELKNEQAQTVAQSTIVVARLITDLRPRRRYGWSIF